MNEPNRQSRPPRSSSAPMFPIVRRISRGELDTREGLLGREWLVTNGLGGYASGTLAGVATRRYHGLLVAALPAPLGRMMMLDHVAERLHLPDGRVVHLGCDRDSVLSGGHLAGFRLEGGLPVWRYEVEELVIERRVVLPHLQNTVHITYTLLAGEGELRLDLCPSMHIRPHDHGVGEPLHMPYTVTACGSRYEVSAAPELPVLRMLLFGRQGLLTMDGGSTREAIYRLEAERGYDARGTLWSPGYFSARLSLEEGLDATSATLCASAESWETILALDPVAALETEHDRRVHLLEAAPAAAREGVGAELLLAADQFLITPAGRAEEAARARAAGDEARTVIAGYHWFTDWGRDTMISLEGLTLATGRAHEGGSILRTFAHYVRDGLLPNLFPEGEREGLYHTVDATLWFFHALDRYVEATGDRLTLRHLMPVLVDIVDHHLRGTRFHIGVDPEDGLLRQGAEGYQLTWMDAKVEDWVVTPRRGKAVEVNALWHNALSLLAGWLEREGEGELKARAGDIAARAEQARESFNQRFWYQDGGYLYDVVDGEHGNDPACRPNQLLAISLPHPVLERSRWEPVVDTVRSRLLTPVGLRSLAPGHAAYEARYFGDLRARDAAYHQGTVWAWLIGPFIDAWLAVHPDDPHGARRFLSGFERHLSAACVGSISEIFDAEKPFAPRGCVAQAWSVAEVLRCWIKTSA